MRLVSRLLPMALLTLCCTVQGQSLGDVARQNRQKEKQQTKPAKKVVTNEDIPVSPESTSSSSDTGAKGDTALPPDGAPPPKSAREWKLAIMAQRDRVETIQAQIDKLSESIHFVTANAYVNGAEYNQYQVRKQQEVKNLKKQLEEQQKKLSDLQEAARKEGMGGAVYEPEE
jgi:chemotaxis protein histidine kinase CheA